VTRVTVARERLKARVFKSHWRDPTLASAGQSVGHPAPKNNWM